MTFHALPDSPLSADVIYVWSQNLFQLVQPPTIETAIRTVHLTIMFLFWKTIVTIQTKWPCLSWINDFQYGSICNQLTFQRNVFSWTRWLVTSLTWIRRPAFASVLTFFAVTVFCRTSVAFDNEIFYWSALNETCRNFQIWIHEFTLLRTSSSTYYVIYTNSSKSFFFRIQPLAPYCKLSQSIILVNLTWGTLFPSIKKPYKTGIFVRLIESFSRYVSISNRKLQYYRQLLSIFISCVLTWSLRYHHYASFWFLVQSTKHYQ